MKPVGREEEVFCPSCRRYVGTFERCPYCGAKVPKRLAFRLLKWGALAVAVFGIMFLYLDLHGPHIIVKEPYQVSINEITSPMNMAQVVIQGKATFVKYYDDTRFLGMFLSDLENENADIFIRAYDAETLRLINMEKERLDKNDPTPKFPAVGDIVTIRGQLRVRATGKVIGPEGFRMMILQYAEGLLDIERPTATPTTIENIVENKENFGKYQRVEVEGKIISTRDMGWATLLTLYEMQSGAELGVMVPSLLEQFGKTLETFGIKIGDTVRVKGAFQLYYGTPQLWLASWDDLVAIG
ncbi:MAG: hypothetical protein QMD00_02275 [Hadesarchaea archaeon]|nr:hypothetical protein [Hadesarchaea archaeon]